MAETAKKFSEDTMTVKEVAELFNRSVTTIYSWRDKKIITPVYSNPSGRGEVYSRAEIYALHNKGFNRAN